MPRPDVQYKIRRKDTGEFSSGGTRPRWEQDGKVWPDRKAVSAHISMTTDIQTGLTGPDDPIPVYVYIDQPVNNIEVVAEKISTDPAKPGKIGETVEHPLLRREARPIKRRPTAQP
jgi:hypothetical protein